jgi:hypothetical protein
MRSFFACECSGCRGYRVQFEDMRYNTARAVESLNGYYFSSGAMRFFGAKITHFYPLEKGGAVFFSTMKGSEEGTRVRTFVVYCPYGNLVNDCATDNRPTVTAKSLKAFEHARTVGAYDFLVSSECGCHGCQIDRDGLREIEDAEICISCPTHCAGE